MKELSGLNETAEQIIEKYADMVYRLAFAKMGTRHDADDIFQEVFLRYVRKKPSFKDETHRKAWLIRVTVNCCKKAWSSSWRRAEPLDERAAFEYSESLELYDALQKIPLKYREVLHLFYYEDMSVKEISLALDRKESTVRSQLTRARKILKDFIRGDDCV